MKHFFTLAATILCAATMMAQAPQTEVEADCGSQVTITATPNEGYHFVRWNDNDTHASRQVDVTGNATYTAYFAINQYTINFYDDLGGNLIATGSGTYNHFDVVTAPVAVVDFPIKASTDQYYYTFDGWSPTLSPTAVASVDYIAQWEAHVRSYTITFQNWDGTPLQSSDWEYGTLPVYGGSTPTRPADDEYTYIFSGWDHTISAVTGEDTYIAQYNTTTNSYTLTVSGDNGTTTGSGTYQYGTNVTITATPNECYHFVKWSDNDTNPSRSITITGTTNLTAIFEINKFTIQVISDDPTQGSVSVSQ